MFEGEIHAFLAYLCARGGCDLRSIQSMALYYVCRFEINKKNHVNLNALLLELMLYGNIIFALCYVRGGGV